MDKETLKKASEIDAKIKRLELALVSLNLNPKIVIEYDDPLEIDNIIMKRKRIELGDELTTYLTIRLGGIIHESLENANNELKAL